MSIKDQALNESLAAMGRIATLADLLADQDHDDITQALAHSIHALAKKAAGELMDALDAIDASIAAKVKGVAA